MAATSDEYKSSGKFESKRVQLFQEFSNNPNEVIQLQTLVDRFVQLKIEKDPSILLKNNNKIAILLQEEISKAKTSWSLSKRQDFRSSKEQLSGLSEEGKLALEIVRYLDGYVDSNVTENRQLLHGIDNSLRS
ncbi:hypothetical protein DAMA08_004350 [Martiniozyma asiatica (nom. inval.)]|nr:hypothetical protein DAMA08_004350 [Martiniozyma asiatica]